MSTTEEASLAPSQGRSNESIVTSPAARIVPPSELTGGCWLAESYVSHLRWRLPVAGVMLLVACTTRTARDKAVQRVASRTGMPHEGVERLLFHLEEVGLVLVGSHAESAEVNRFGAIAANWKTLGWEEAAEYHLSTLDYPFIDYEHHGRDVDTSRMLEYIRRDPDVDRYKRYPGSQMRVDLPRPAAELVPVAVSEGLREVNGTALDRGRLLNILSIACAETGRITGGRWPRAPMVRRTSPSGGARHPTEAYVLVLDVLGLAPGWYHVEVETPRLEQLSETRPTDAELRCAFPLGYARVPIEPDAIVVLTSVFHRNMYRYREPRTFRTVHMDAGHLASTLAMAAAALDVRAHIAYPDDDGLIERMIGLSELREAYMLSIALGARGCGRAK